MQGSLGEELSKLWTPPKGTFNHTERIILVLVIKGVVVRHAWRFCSKLFQMSRFFPTSVVSCPYKIIRSLAFKNSVLIQDNLFT